MLITAQTHCTHGHCCNEYNAAVNAIEATRFNLSAMLLCSFVQFVREYRMHEGGADEHIIVQVMSNE